MNGCESWTIKKAEHQRIDAFELWCWIRLLRILWTARRSNQSILKEINPEYSLEGLMLKLKLQYFGHLMWGIDSFKKTLMLGKIEDRRRRRQQRMRCLVGITDVMDMNLIWLHELVMACCSPWHCKGSDTTEPLNWTDQADNNRRLKFYKIMWRNIICHYSDLEYCFFITQLEKGKQFKTRSATKHFCLCLLQYYTVQWTGEVCLHFSNFWIPSKVCSIWIFADLL